MAQPTWDVLSREQKTRLIKALTAIVRASNSNLSYYRMWELLRKDKSLKDIPISPQILDCAATNADCPMFFGDRTHFRRDLPKYGGTEFNPRISWRFVQLYRLLPTMEFGSTLFQASVEELERMQKEMSRQDCSKVLHAILPDQNHIESVHAFLNAPKTSVREMLEWTERMGKESVPFYSGQRVRIYKEETGTSKTYLAFIYRILVRNKRVRVCLEDGHMQDYPYKWEDGEFRVNGNPVYGVN